MRRRGSHLNPRRNPSTTAGFPTRTPTTSSRDPAGWQRVSKENDLQGGRSRVPSARRPALLRTGGAQFGRSRGVSRCSGPPASRGDPP
ncbi:hypothetical protein NDU88_010200 [Pleurodeles waltl]|uniref:Uncharacterized protein n=1 Tax=Pleurodeles waltl TaxID=8319 RepID=A0AAV7QZK6_PLEWA|nr:hypothetical protein NDU88_010200 [Pleurodeles waltl]